VTTTFHNDRDGTFSEQAETSGAFDRERYFGLGVVAADLEGTAISTSTSPTTRHELLFVNRGDGRFDERGFASGLAFSGDGNEQASMGVDAADYDNDGRLGRLRDPLRERLQHALTQPGRAALRRRDRPGPDPRLRMGLREVGDRLRRPRSRRLEGHRTRERARLPAPRAATGRETYEQPALSVYLNGRDGTFRDVSDEAGPGAAKRVLGRGTALADLDNDGDLDVVVACLDSTPVLLRNDGASGHWLMFRAVAARATGDGIGARITVRAGSLSQVAR